MNPYPFPTRASVAQARMQEVASLPQRYAMAHSSELSGLIEQLSSKQATPDEFYEFAPEAQVTIDTTCHALMVIKEAAQQNEQESIQRQGDQQRRAMDAIKEIQALSLANGSANVLESVINMIHELVRQDDFGLGAETVKQAKQAALDQLRPRYEQALIAEMGNSMRTEANEIYGLFDEADGMIEESSASDDEIILAVCHHFGWDKETTINRLKAINFDKEPQ